MQITNKEKNLLFFLAVMMIIVITVNFIITPGFTKYKELKDQLLLVEDSKFQTDQLLARANTIDAEIEQVLVNTEEMIPAFFNIVDKEYIHMWIGSLADKNKVKIESLIIGDPQVATVTPYIRTDSILSYPIGEYFNNMVNSTTLETGQEETISSEEAIISSEDSTDQVIRIDLTLNLKGTKSTIMNLVSEISHLEKHGIINNVAFTGYNVDDEKTTSIGVTLYSIHKEDDRVFSYPFK